MTRRSRQKGKPTMAKFIQTEEGDIIDPHQISGVYMKPLFESTDEDGNVLASSGPYTPMAVMLNGDEYYLEEGMSLDEAIAFVEEAQS